MTLDRREPGAADLAIGVEAYLLSLAQSLHEAQRRLNQMHVLAEGDVPGVAYQLPRLDFELKMAFEVSTQADGRPALHARPVGATPTTTAGEHAEAAAASVIKGTFVAVPAQGGRPRTLVRLRLEGAGARRLVILVDLSSAAGEQLEGAEVQFNVDRELSRRLNELDHVSWEESGGPYLGSTSVGRGSRVTVGGTARAILVVDPGVPVGANVAVVVDAAGETHVVVFRVSAAAPVSGESVPAEEAEDAPEVPEAATEEGAS